MPCFTDGGISICKPTIKITKVGISFCPTCKSRRKFFGWFQDWYGWHITCLKCGDQWQDGERLERPFMPKWRQKSIESAKRMMREASRLLAGEK